MDQPQIMLVTVTQSIQTSFTIVNGNWPVVDSIEEAQEN